LRDRLATSRERRDVPDAAIRIRHGREEHMSRSEIQSLNRMFEDAIRKQDLPAAIGHKPSTAANAASYCRPSHRRTTTHG
jgi:hypothetical protein